MGWTGLHRRKGITNKEFFESEWPGLEILDAYTRGNVVYLAARYAEPCDEDRRAYGTFAIVVITKWHKPDDWGCNFGYKEMDESMHPFYYDCPEKILNILSPTDNESAKEWRKLCRATPQQRYQWHKDMTEAAGLRLAI